MLLRYSHHQIFVFIGEFGLRVLYSIGTVYRLFLLHGRKAKKELMS